MDSRETPPRKEDKVTGERDEMKTMVYEESDEPGTHCESVERSREGEKPKSDA